MILYSKIYVGLTVLTVLISLLCSSEGYAMEENEELNGDPTFPPRSQANGDDEFLANFKFDTVTLKDGKHHISIIDGSEWIWCQKPCIKCHKEKQADKEREQIWLNVEPGTELCFDPTNQMAPDNRSMKRWMRQPQNPANY